MRYFNKDGSGSGPAKERREDAVHLNYIAPPAESKRRKGCVELFCDMDQADADHECCNDIWGTFLSAPKKGPRRECRKEETFQLNFFKVFTKQVVSAILFSVVVWYIYITTSLTDSADVDLFNCDANDPRSLNFLNKAEFSDEGVQFCYFKSTMIVVSFVLLFPFLLETFSVLTIIWVSSINNQVLVPVVEGKYVGYDDIFDSVHSVNLLRRTYQSLMTFIKVPAKIMELNSEQIKPVSTYMLMFEMFWKLNFFMLPDLILTAALFPVSYYVMITSDTPEDILVNLVAVQVFAELDDIFVKMLLNPRSSCGERIMNYVNANPNGDRATYSPFQAYSMNENRHEMGVKVPQYRDMRDFHDYTGHHLTS